MAKKGVKATLSRGKKSNTTLNIGRPSKYSEEMTDKLCELISQGKSLRYICSLPEMPSETRVYAWLSENESFRDKYARARELQAEFYANEIVEIADSVQEDVSAVAKARLQVDTRKWVASKLAPKKYGDKVQQEVSGDLGVNMSLKVVFE